jgi:hypothetical protein
MHYISLFYKSPAYLAVVALSLFFLVFCATIENPYKEPENIGISLTVAGDSGVAFHTISDSLNLEIALKLANLVKFVIVEWNSPAELRDTIKVTTNEFEDTIDVTHVFTSEGERIIRASAVPANSSMQKSAEIMIRIGRRPVITGNGRVLIPEILRPDTACFLAVAATGSDTLGYSWYRNNKVLSSAAKDTIFFDSVTSADTGSYFCIVSNSWGSDTSNLYRLLDTVSFNAPVRITMTSPLMKYDSAVMRTSLLAIGGTSSSAAGIASVSIYVDAAQVSVVGMQAWSFAVSELTAGEWNRVRIIARDNSGAGDTLTVFLFLMPDLSVPSTPAVRERLCTRIDLGWRKIPLCSLYLVYRFTADSPTPDTVMETADTVLIDSGLSPGLSYYYRYRGWYSVPGMNAIADTTIASTTLYVKTVQCYEKTFGGLSGDSAIGVVVTPDSGCLVAGTSLSTRPGFSDIYLVRLDESGDTVWTNPYGPMQSYMAVTMRPGAKGEVIVGGGYTCASCGMQNVACVTAFSVLNGAPIFNTVRDRPESNPAYDAIRSITGGFAYVSWTRPPAGLYTDGVVDTVVYAYMLNAAGDSLWKKYLAFDNLNTKAWSVAQSAEGSLYLTGLSTLAIPPVGGVPPQPHCFVAKISSAGDSLWSRMYGASATYTKGVQIRSTADGGFIIAGETAVTGLPRDMYLLKITNQGAQQWAYSYGTAGEDFAVQVVECSDNGFALAGGSYGATGSDCNAYLVKTNASGVKQWDAVFGGAQFDCARALTQTPDSGFVLAGETRSSGAGGVDMYVIKTDKRGSKIK